MIRPEGLAGTGSKSSESIPVEMKEPDHTPEDPVSESNDAQADGYGGDDEQRPVIGGREGTPEGHERNHHPCDCLEVALRQGFPAEPLAIIGDAFRPMMCPLWLATWVQDEPHPHPRTRVLRPRPT